MESCRCGGLDHDALAIRYEWQWDLMDGWASGKPRHNIVILDTRTGMCYTGVVGGGRGYIEAEIDEMIKSGELK